MEAPVPGLELGVRELEKQLDDDGRFSLRTTLGRWSLRIKGR